MSGDIVKTVSHVRVDNYILLNNKVCKCSEINVRNRHPESRTKVYTLTVRDIIDNTIFTHRCFSGSDILFPDVHKKKYYVLDCKVVDDQKYIFVCCDHFGNEKSFSFSSGEEKCLAKISLCKEIIDKFNNDSNTIVIDVMVISDITILISYHEE